MGAKEWAENMLETGMRHSSQEERKNAGENLYYDAGTASVGGTPCQRASDSWYREALRYNFNTGKGSGVLHFTQMVWKSTTKVGCGVSKGQVRGMETTYVCCRYQPAGNMIGSETKNVMKLKDGMSVQDAVKEDPWKTNKRNSLHKNAKKMTKSGKRNVL
uniref:SCP domain-containing protein n=2 Tax=Clytia hemisphaerica TaxID=252671 RepID=A0A7M5VCG7_9CNID|eukprot:TCONS_00046361-protein